MEGIYFCSRLRILEWLTSHGQTSCGVMPDKYNNKYSCWLFQRTPEFDAILETYHQKRKEEQEERN